MCKEDREIETRLNKLVKARKIDSFRMCWVSGKFIVRREKLKKSIHNEYDTEQFENMEPMKEKPKNPSFMDEDCSFDM